MLLCMLEVLEVPETMRCVLLCMLEAVEGGLCLLEALEVMLCMLKAVEGGLCLREASEVLEVMRRVLLGMLEAVEGGLCLREASEMLEVMRRVLLGMLEAVEGGFSLGISKFPLWQFSRNTPPLLDLHFISLSLEGAAHSPLHVFLHCPPPSLEYFTMPLPASDARRASPFAGLAVGDERSS